jgi:hypothetical protein
MSNDYNNTSQKGVSNDFSEEAWWTISKVDIDREVISKILGNEPPCYRLGDWCENIIFPPSGSELSYSKIGDCIMETSLVKSKEKETK